MAEIQVSKLVSAFRTNREAADKAGVQPNSEEDDHKNVEAKPATEAGNDEGSSASASAN